MGTDARGGAMLRRIGLDRSSHLPGGGAQFRDEGNRDGEGGAVTHADGGAFVGEVKFCRHIFPGLEIAGAHGAVVLFLISIKVDQGVSTDQEGCRAFDPQAGRGKRGARGGERALKAVVGGALENFFSAGGGFRL